MYEYPPRPGFLIWHSVMKSNQNFSEDMRNGECEINEANI